MSRSEELSIKYGEENTILPEGYNDGEIPYYEKATADAFLDGYHQAEKDLALTWEDMRKIHEICEDVWEPNVEDEKPIYEEVLRRFNEQRRK